MYSRRYLYSVSAHRADQRGINGNIKFGADSLVVSRQNPQLREEDGLQWLRYTSSRRQGAGALCLSYSRRQPVRVFRSSNLTTCYAPPEFDGGRTSYRYDGLCKLTCVEIMPYTCFVSSPYHSYVLDLVTKVWDDDGNLMTVENDLNISVGIDQYTFHLERLQSSFSLVDDDTCNSMSIQELWNTIQVSRLLPTSPFVHVHPKHNGASLPKLLCNDKGDSAKTVLKYTNPHVKLSSLYPLTASLPLKKAAMKLKTANLNDVRTSRSYEDWNRTHDPLGSTICERNNTISGRRLHVHSYTASNRIPWTYESYPALPNTSHLLPYHQSTAVPTNINHRPLIANPQHISSVMYKPKQLKIKPKERDCDFDDSKSIIKCFRLYNGCLRPLLSEITKLRTKEEKIQYVRKWRSMTREEQEQYKKVKREEAEVIKQQILNEKSRRGQELKELARRKKISITRKAKREMMKFTKTFVLSLDDAICEIKTTPEKKTESIRQRKTPVKKKHINNTSHPRQKKSPIKKIRNSPAIRVQSPPKSNKRKTTSVEDDKRSMRRAKRSRLVTGPDTIEKSHHHKVKPRMVDKKSYTPKQKKVKQTTASKKQSPRRTIRTNSKSSQVKNESPRKKITPRFVTDKESGMQTLASPMVAFCRLEKRSRKRDVNVRVKWASK